MIRASLRRRWHGRGKFLLVAEKGWDKIVIYKFDEATGTLTPNTPPAVDATKLRAAPRHLTFHPNGKFLYVCYEAGRAVSTFAWYAAKGAVPHVIYSAGHNHISQIGSVGVDDLAMGAQLARFVNRVTGS